MNENEFTNQLINEKSPYLLQHAHNPVYWYPWGDEAFQQARKENKPVFLSIGYSTCHWCHVMERESFEDVNVAKILNEHFIAIKVDREERPDIDNVYMEVCQALTGSGGWPLSLIMTPDKLPFYAGTYFPKADFRRLLQMIHDRWESDRDKLVASAGYIAQEIGRTDSGQAEEMPDDDITMVAFEELRRRFDPRYGGFSDRPKFPTPHHLLFLLRYHHAYNDPEALTMVEKTLTQMYKGGIFDHIGFGFSRYATDHRWLVPHFEKMLYDNALLAMAYAEGYLVTGTPLYKEVADRIMKFVSREMTSPEGAFYTALDADSEGVEGKYYLWTTEELEKLLQYDDFKFICDYFNVTAKGNFEGRNILNLIHLDDLRLEKYDQARVERITDTLYAARLKRIPPHLDDKILTSWNAMMIASYASVGRMLGEGEYVAKAEKAMAFIMTHLKGENNRLYARYRDGEAKYRGYLDDYAYMVWALSELYLATSKEDYLNQAIAYNHQMLDLFKDETGGGYFQIGQDSEQLFMNPKTIYDGAVPSGNSVATMNLIRLFEITGNPDLDQEAKSQFRAFAESINNSPTASTFMLCAYLLFQASKTKIIMVTDKTLKELSEKLRQTYRPFQTAIILDKNQPSEQFTDYVQQQSDFALYICQNNSCTAPIYDEHEALQALERL